MRSGGYWIIGGACVTLGLGCEQVARGESPKSESLPQVVSSPAPVIAQASRVQATLATAIPSEMDVLLSLQGLVSTSLGGPGTGTLEGGVALPKRGPGFLHNPRRPNTAARYGTVEMVQGLVRASALVHNDFPKARLFINDLGFERGGPIAHHGSHQGGRDVDILFYLRDAHGKPTTPKGIPLDPKGEGWDFHDLKIGDDDVRVELDAEKTWRFMQALLETSADHVQRIFIAEHVRTLLLEQAAKAQAPANIIARFSDITCQPETPHDDHFHVRFYCSAEDIQKGCQDSNPWYEWRLAQLAALQVTPVAAKMKVRKSRTKPRSSPELTALYNAMHSRAREFMRARDIWAVRPHPGRRFCR